MCICSLCLPSSNRLDIHIILLHDAQLREHEFRGRPCISPHASFPSQLTAPQGRAPRSAVILFPGCRQSMPRGMWYMWVDGCVSWDTIRVKKRGPPADRKAEGLEPSFSCNSEL